MSTNIVMKPATKNTRNSSERSSDQPEWKRMVSYYRIIYTVKDFFKSLAFFFLDYWNSSLYCWNCYYNISTQSFNNFLHEYKLYRREFILFYELNRRDLLKHWSSSDIQTKLRICITSWSFLWLGGG